MTLPVSVESGVNQYIQFLFIFGQTLALDQGSLSTERSRNRLHGFFGLMGRHEIEPFPQQLFQGPAEHLLKGRIHINDFALRIIHGHRNGSGLHDELRTFQTILQVLFNQFPFGNVQ